MTLLSRPSSSTLTLVKIGYLYAYFETRVYLYLYTPTYVPTKLNVADVFTKILGGDDFERLVHMMMPRNCPQRKEKNCVVQIARMFPIWTA